MYNLLSKLVVYREAGEHPILKKLSDITRRFEAFTDQAPDESSLNENFSGVRSRDKKAEREGLISDIHEVVHELLDLATDCGFDGNLWHNYIAYLIAMTETPFTLVSEKVGAVGGSVNEFAKADLAILKQLFDYDFSPIEKELDIDTFSVIENYQAVEKAERIYNKNVSDKVRELSEAMEKAADIDELYAAVTTFYKNYGVGKFGLNQAFRIDDDLADILSGRLDRTGKIDSSDFLIPITTRGHETLDDLVGYEEQKRELIENTEAFVHGKAANNVLLYGDAGTGKSTSIKAILNQYYPEGLRMIEVYKHEFKYLNRIISEIKNRNYRFIIYMDDLSFEEFEIEYKYLKAVIEGGLEPKPDNVVIYATSNRRHLIRETWSDRNDASADDLHRNDTVQEKLSLSARFGVTIGFFKPAPKEFKEIVLTLAHRHPEITLTDDEILSQANVWEMSHGGISGRTAAQFITYLCDRT
ncbi:MAG: ATP-binding protein [Lachnospiraceae bacterium]|nr:ATP-binding protein [Lachnospiraceae bacterium]